MIRCSPAPALGWPPLKGAAMNDTELCLSNPRDGVGCMGGRGVGAAGGGEDGGAVMLGLVEIGRAHV